MKGESQEKTKRGTAKDAEDANEESDLEWSVFFAVPDSMAPSSRSVKWEGASGLACGRSAGRLPGGFLL